MLELVDLWAGEQRTLLLELVVPAMPALGLAEVASLELRYVRLPDLVEQVVTLPVSVNVVPGVQAAGRVRNPKVRQESDFQQAQDAKKRAAEALDRGDEGVALDLLRSAGSQLSLDPDEQHVVLSLASDIEAGQANRAAKRSRMEHDRKNRKRGRGM